MVVRKFCDGCDKELSRVNGVEMRDYETNEVFEPGNEFKCEVCATCKKELDYYLKRLKKSKE